MKKLLLSLVIAGIPLLSNAQVPSIQWEKCLGGSAADAATSIKPAWGGGYIVTGYTCSANGDVTNFKGIVDYWIVRINDTGAILWQRSLGGSNLEGAGAVGAVQQTSDSGFIAVGWSMSNDSDVTGNHGGSDCWVMKLSKTGTLQWQRSLGGSSTDYGWSVLQNTDGSFIVVSDVQSSDGDVSGNHGNSDAWVVKLSSSGTIIWQKTYGGTGEDAARAIAPTADGGYIIGGSSTSTDGDVTVNHGLTDSWVIKISATGSLQWQKTYGGTGNENAMCIKQTTDGGYIVTGYTSSHDGDVIGYKGGSYDYWLLKLNATGGIVWQRALGGSDWDTPYSVDQTTDGGYIVAGMSKSNDSDVTGHHGDYDYWVVKTSSTGNIQWQRSYGGTGTENIVPCIFETSDKGYIFCGASNSSNGDVTGNHGNTDMWVVKIGPDSILVHYNGIQSIAHGGANITVFPNPAESVINISGAATATTRLYNMYGQLLKEVTNTSSIPVAEYVPGVYFVKIYDEKGDLIYQGSVVKQ